MKKLTIVTSVYNGSESFRTFSLGVIELRKNLAENWIIDLIIVDDASTDNSWHIILEEQKKMGMEGILSKSFKQLKNKGQHQSLFDGLTQIKDNDSYVVLIDGDGEEDPRRIVDLVQIIESEEVDSVIAIQNRKDSTFVRGFLGKIAWKIIKFLQIESVNTNECTLRILNPISAKLLISNQVINPILGREQSKLGLRTRTITVNKKFKGFTSYNFKKRWQLLLRNLTYSNSVYIRLSQLTLLIGILFGSLAGLFFIYYYIINPDPVEGYTSIGLLISSMFSLNFIVLSFLTKLSSKTNESDALKYITFRESFEVNND